MNQVTFSDLKFLNIFEEIEVRNLNLTSLGIEGTNVPPIFKKTRKELFHIGSERILEKKFH